MRPDSTLILATGANMLRGGKLRSSFLVVRFKWTQIHRAATVPEQNHYGKTNKDIDIILYTGRIRDVRP